MSRSRDYLYELLPAVYRMRDADAGFPLRALLRVAGEQLTVLDDDIAALYANWFVETAADWVVPYLGDLVGYRPVPAAAGHLPVRRDVAHTINHRRRKGTLALLDELAGDVAGWPGHAVEFYRLLGWTQHVNHVHPDRGGTAGLRRTRALERLGGPFDTMAHTVDVRSPVSVHARGRFDIGSLGLFVARLGAYPVTDAPACCVEKEGAQCFTFSVLGNDAPLFSIPGTGPGLELPGPIGRRAFEQRTSLHPPQASASPSYYGPSMSVSAPGWAGQVGDAIPAGNVIPADLSDWHAYRPARGTVLLDPVRGRLVFPAGSPPKSVSVTYHYGFSAEMGGGEYHRMFPQPAGARVYRVRKNTGPGEYGQVMAAYAQWTADRAVPDPGTGVPPRAAVIEIMDSRAYEERFEFALTPGESLQLRAADGARPVLRLLDYRVDQADPFSITGGDAARFTLDGLLVVGRGLAVNGPAARRVGPDEDPTAGGDLCDVTIRHCTLVPGWNLDCDCAPQRPEEPSLTLDGTAASVRIEHSILGGIAVQAAEPVDLRAAPPRIVLSDSIVDATDPAGQAVGDPTGRTAFIALSMARCTVIGDVLVHVLDRADDTIFLGPLRVARRQLGCVRFCYLAPGTRAPRRFHCQPDLARQAAADLLAATGQPVDPAALAAAQDRAALRVRPTFTSLRYGAPAYAQLGPGCAVEISTGAGDEAELGAFHDLYQPQRAAGLRARLDEYTAAGFETGIFHTS
ncbi:hypothetical protein [Specibacter cremeus]|uniref:hypothetical protein n=1 Tax=Specibacter cremeus TaxID=1629051 RepID=UPI000F7A5741|nr:hypothetical protein [Specibacter cremeus]